MKPANSRYANRLLAAIVVISALLLAVLWLSHPKPDTLAFEAAKGCIGIFTVALVGFVVSRAASAFQREWESERDRERSVREEQNRVSDLRREDWRRDLEQRRDERQRKDELLRSILHDALTNYHEVKRARRQFRARIWAEEHGGQVDSDVYDEYVTVINDAQLNFELLTHTAGLIDDERVDPKRLATRFRSIEEHLGGLVSEYEKHRRRVAHGADTVGIAELPELEAFFERDKFRSSVSTNHWSVVEDLRTALLRPLVLPLADASCASSDYKDAVSPASAGGARPA